MNCNLLSENTNVQDAKLSQHRELASLTYVCGIQLALRDDLDTLKGIDINDSSSERA